MVSILGTVLTLGLLGIGIAFAMFISRALLSVPDEAASTILMASIPVLGSVLVVLISRSLEKKRELENSQRTHKTALYLEFITWWITLLSTRQKEALTKRPDDVKGQFARFHALIIAWSSDEVIRKYRKFKELSTKIPERRQEGDESARSATWAVLKAFESLLLEMRQELGHTDLLKPGELLGIIMTDLPDIGDFSRHRLSPQ